VFPVYTVLSQVKHLGNDEVHIIWSEHSHFPHTVFPVDMTSRFPAMLLTSVPVDWPQKQSSVTINFPSEKYPCDVPLIKIIDHLFKLYHTSE